MIKRFGRAAIAAIALLASPLAARAGTTIITGSFCMGLDTGSMAAALAAGSPIFSFRFGGVSSQAIIRRVYVSVADGGTAFAAGSASFDLLAARSFSASDTGGTAATLTTNNGKMATSQSSTQVSDFRISSTGTLTPGTRTLDATPLASFSGGVPAVAGQSIIPPATQILKAPLTLAGNEGFVIQATFPATGVWKASVTVCWDEVILN